MLEDAIVSKMEIVQQEGNRLLKRLRGIHEWRLKQRQKKFLQNLEPLENYCFLISFSNGEDKSFQGKLLLW